MDCASLATMNPCLPMALFQVPCRVVLVPLNVTVAVGGPVGTMIVYWPVAMGLGFIPDLKARALRVALFVKVTGELYSIELVVGLLPSIV